MLWWVRKGALHTFMLFYTMKLTEYSTGSQDWVWWGAQVGCDGLGCGCDGPGVIRRA